MTDVKRVDFFYDFSCPYAYLAHTQIEALAARTGAELRWRPFLLGGVFQAIGTPAVPAETMPAAKARMNLLDMHRFADHLGVPLRMPDTHPNRTVLALRAAIASGDLARASKALYSAYWVLGRDVSKPEVVSAALDDAGFDGAGLVRRADDPAVKADLRARTEEAVTAGVFGAPASVVTRNGGAPELFWGQDRLAFVERALQGTPAPSRSEWIPRSGDSRAIAAAGERPKQIWFYFDFSSPFSYLGATQIQAVAARHGAALHLRPFLLGALFKAIGTPNVPLLTMPAAKQHHYRIDLVRWAEHWRVPFRFPSIFPMSTVKVLRIFLQLDDADRRRLMLPLFRAYWVEDRDISDEGTLAALLAEAGVDPAPLLDGTRDDAVKERLRLATEEAEATGVCGAPSFLVDAGAGEPQLFWGQDRLELVEKALAGVVSSSSSSGRA